MYELRKNGKVFTSKFVGTGPSSYEKRIYRAAVSQRSRNTGLFYALYIYIYIYIYNTCISVKAPLSRPLISTLIMYCALHHCTRHLEYTNIFKNQMFPNTIV